MYTASAKVMKATLSHSGVCLHICQAINSYAASTNTPNRLRLRFATKLFCLRKMSVPVSPYGTWKSPISSKLVSESSVRFQEIRLDLQSDQTDVVYWSELRYDEGGRYVICSQKKGEQSFKAWTPKDYNARTRVHEYGGGAFFVNDGAVYFCNFTDQQMYVQTSVDTAPVAITPKDCSWRYADGTFCKTTEKIYCVREDHSLVEKGEGKEAVNTIVSIDPKTQQQHVLASGCDFYSCPRVSPDGKSIAWVQWNHPNMPWDSTAICVGELSLSGDSVAPDSIKQIAGGDGVSVLQPNWTPDGDLLYISDKTGWWNLYIYTQGGNHDNLLPKEAETGGPHWTFGNPYYVIDSTGSGTVITVTNGELGKLNLKTKDYKKIDTGFTSHRMVNLTKDGEIYCEVGSPTKFSSVVKVDQNSGKVEVLRESKSLSLDVGFFSIPEELKWKTSNDDISYGHFYLPKNMSYTAPEGTLPPLLVKAHGGPTSQSPNTMNLGIQYFTSRGFAVLDVNYRGSTGYGTEYRNKLRGNWGIYDVEDCCSGALSLAEKCLVDKDRLCIDGGSAGGYTTLACLTFKSVFKAGASHYGIGDLEALARDTHKFESRYLDTVIAPYKGEGDKTYMERSPINYVDKLNCAMALFQGDEDKIVPPNQAEMMYKAVKSKGHPTVYVLFKGEQHGFRKSENIQTALDGEFYFFAKVFGFDPADKHMTDEEEANYDFTDLFKLKMKGCYEERYIINVQKTDHEFIKT